MTLSSCLTRKQKPSWRTSCRRPKSSRRFVWKRLKSRWCRGRSRSLLRRRRSSALTRSSSLLSRDPPRLKPTRCSSWLRDRSEWIRHRVTVQCTSLKVCSCDHDEGELFFPLQMSKKTKKNISHSDFTDFIWNFGNQSNKASRTGEMLHHQPHPETHSPC